MTERDERVRDLVSVHDDVTLAGMYVDASVRLEEQRRLADEQFVVRHQEAERAERAERERDENEAKVLARIAERGDLHVLGLPVDDLRSIYQLVGEWNRVGGRPSLIEEARERGRLREHEETLEKARAAFRRCSPSACWSVRSDLERQGVTVVYGAANDYPFGYLARLAGELSVIFGQQRAERLRELGTAESVIAALAS